MWNPLYDAWKSVNPPFVPGQSRWDRPHMNVDRSMEAWKMREHVIAEYAFSVPIEPVVRSLVKAAPRVVDFDAGTGYWAKLLKDAGADVVAFDSLVDRASAGDSVPAAHAVRLASAPDVGPSRGRRRMKIHHLLAGVWHALFHRYANHMLERAPGEVFLRCETCGLRSPGLVIGPLRLSSALKGYPNRARLARAAQPVTLAVLDVEVNVMSTLPPWQEAPATGRSTLVH